MKNNIKIFLITILSVAILAGCSGKKEEQAPVQESTLEVTVDDARKNVESSVDISHYIPTEKEDGTISYSFRSDLFTEYDLNHIISLGSDTRINLPQSFPVMRSLGWEPATSLTLKPKASTNIMCAKDGKEIMVYLYNSTDKEIKCSNGEVTRVKLNLYSKEDNYEKALDSAPDFKIGNSIDNKTDMNGIINAIGEPSNIKFSKDGDKCNSITLIYQNVSNRDCLQFVLSPDGTKIVSVDYSKG